MRAWRLILAQVALVLSLGVLQAEPQAAAGIISLKSCEQSGKYEFSPDFSNLTHYERKTQVEGFVPEILCFITKSSEIELNIAPNVGTTQYQGHYIWKSNNAATGFGTYTAAKTNRAIGWIFHNDTGRLLEVRELEWVYGQWGARNSQVDTLDYEWRVSRQPISAVSTNGWIHSKEDSFASPFTTTSENAEFPAYWFCSPKSRPRRLASGSYLAIRFTDSCPSAGSNAHLGLSDFHLQMIPVGMGTCFSIQ